LGLPDAAKGANDPDFCALLAEMQSRNATASPVYYKGPGYRSSLDVHKVQPFVNAIAAKLGIERLMLGASDAPFAGPALEADTRYHNKPLSTLVDFVWMQHYTLQLAAGAAKSQSLNEQDTSFRLLYGNAAQLYGFEVK
jgi:hypothetical protein